MKDHVSDWFYQTQLYLKPNYDFLIETKPKITTHPSSRVVAISGITTNLSLTCEAIGATSYYWERMDGSIPSGATGVNTDILTIVNLTPQDSGNYRCVVSNDGNVSISHYAKITVTG